jgi:hypothetical protein
LSGWDRDGIFGIVRLVGCLGCLVASKCSSWAM